MENTYCTILPSRVCWLPPPIDRVYSTPEAIPPTPTLGGWGVAQDRGARLLPRDVERMSECVKVGFKLSE